MVLKKRSSEQYELDGCNAGPNAGERSTRDIGVLLFTQVGSPRPDWLRHGLYIGKWPQNLELAPLLRF